MRQLTPLSPQCCQLRLTIVPLVRKAAYYSPQRHAYLLQVMQTAIKVAEMNTIKEYIPVKRAGAIQAVEVHTGYLRRLRIAVPQKNGRLCFYLDEQALPAVFKNYDDVIRAKALAYIQTHPISAGVYLLKNGQRQVQWLIPTVQTDNIEAILPAVPQQVRRKGWRSLAYSTLSLTTLTTLGWLLDFHIFWQLVIACFLLLGILLSLIVFLDSAVILIRQKGHSSADRVLRTLLEKHLRKQEQAIDMHVCYKTINKHLSLSQASRRGRHPKRKF